MGKIKKMYFYYGAILNTILQHNPDASPTLILNDEDTRQAYRILTNTANQECILFFKYAACKQQESKLDYSSWIFSFSDDDKEKLRNYDEKDNLPVFICLLCLRNSLSNSEIVILKYEEYLEVKENQSITIGLETGKHNFLLFSNKSKSRKDAYTIPTTRISRTFDELTNEVMKSNAKKFSSPHLVNEKLSLFDVTLQDIKEYENSYNCPKCNSKLSNSVINENGLCIAVRYCPECKSIYLTNKSYRKICLSLNVNRLQDRVYIMNFKKEKQHDQPDPISRTEKFSKLDDTIYIIENESSICPIHNIKMKIKVINFGQKKSDTVMYCPICKKKIISQKHVPYFQGLINSQRISKKYVFENLLL